MCTLSWSQSPETGLEIFFNRDERKTRAIADPPTRHEQDGSSFLSPRDPQGQGTWMLANEHGLVICLLNKWELEGRALSDPQSRGRLVWGLSGHRALSEIDDSLTGLSSYQAFTLAVFSADEQRLWEWDGQSLVSSAMPAFLTSSSYRFEEVRAAREASFLQGHPHQDFHAARDKTPSAYTVRMNRPDAQTWSRSHLRVTDRISWDYLAEQPDLRGDPVKTSVELALRPSK